MIIAAYTTLGLTRRAAARAAGTPLTYDLIRAVTSSSGFVASAAAILPLTAMPGDSAGTRVDNADPTGRASGNIAQFAFTGTGVGAYSIYSFGLFQNDELLAYVCDDAGAAIGSKTTGTTALASMTVVFSNGDTAGTTFANDYILIPPATDEFVGGVTLGSQADINAETGDGVVTGSRLGAWWAQRTVAIAKVTGLATELARYVTVAAFNTRTAAVDSIIALKANIASPTLTGTPRSTTPPASDDSTRIATTAYVKDQKVYRPVSWAKTVDRTGSTLSVTGLGFTPVSYTYLDNRNQTGGRSTTREEGYGSRGHGSEPARGYDIVRGYAQGSGDQSEITINAVTPTFGADSLTIPSISLGPNFIVQINGYEEVDIP